MGCKIAKFREILSHSVRYGVYDTGRLIDIQIDSYRHTSEDMTNALFASVVDLHN